MEIIGIPVTRRRGLYARAAEWVAEGTFAETDFWGRTAAAERVAESSAGEDAAGSERIASAGFSEVLGIAGVSGVSGACGAEPASAVSEMPGAVGAAEVSGVSGIVEVAAPEVPADGGGGRFAPAGLPAAGWSAEGLSQSPSGWLPSEVARPAAVVAGGWSDGFGGGGASSGAASRTGTQNEWEGRIRDAADRAVASALAGLRVYVVESDITDAQQAVRAVVEQSKI